jgi:hypothetical protein
VLFGATEGRDPSPAFNTKSYFEKYPDLAKTNINPLVHFINNRVPEHQIEYHKD